MKTASDLLKEHSVKMKTKQETLHVVPKLSTDEGGGALFTPDNVTTSAHIYATPPDVTTPIAGGRRVKKGVSLPSPAHLEPHPSGGVVKSPLSSPASSSLCDPAPSSRPSAAKVCCYGDVLLWRCVAMDKVL